MMTVAAAALGAASCSETWDGNPVLKTHDGVLKEDFLNDPPLRNQYIALTKDTKEGSFNLTCSQPDYGYAALATYKVQVSLTEDFAEYQEVSQGFYNCAQINPLNHDMAGKIEQLYGIEKEGDMAKLPEGYFPVWVRLRAYVAQDEEHTQYISNPVCYQHISINYFAVWIAGEPSPFYMRGGMNDWGSPEEWRFKTGEISNTWVLDNVTIKADTSIKVAYASWDAGPNLGGNAGENEDSQYIEPGEEVAMANGPASGHLRLRSKFTGKVVLREENGVYYITFEPAS